MRNLILLEYSQDLMYVVNNGQLTIESKYNKRFDKVKDVNKSYAAIPKSHLITISTYDELFNEIVNKILPNRNKWLEEFEIPTNTINENEPTKFILKGDFESDMFMVEIKEGYSIVCMTKEKYETVRYLQAYQLIDYIKYWISKQK